LIKAPNPCINPHKHLKNP